MRERDNDAEQPYWQDDREIGRVHLWGETFALQLRTRAVVQPYQPSQRRELVPLMQAGRSTELAGQVYVVEPRLSPLLHWRRRTHQPLPVRPRELDIVRIGDVHAVVYDRDRTIALWDCSLLPAYQEAEPVLDPNLRSLWQGTEALLSRRFPEAARIVTPSWDPAYAVAEYRCFLADRGYARLSPRTYAKPASAVLR